MSKILKTALIPLLLILPWIIIRLSNSQDKILQFMRDNPLVLILVFLPSLWILARWLINLIKK